MKNKCGSFFRSFVITLSLTGSVFFLCNCCLKAQPVSTVVSPEWSRDKIIYEANIRQITQSGTFKEFQTMLPKLKELGVGIIWLMPIHPIGEVNRKGTLGSYYAVKDYRAINPEFGNEEDLDALVKEIHRLGMYVIIDWVANHTSWDNALAKTNPGFYKQDSLGNFFAPVPDWKDVIALNYKNKDLWNYMTESLEYWVKNFDIDGFRCDVASMVPTPFWNFAVDRLKKTKDVFMLAESDSPDLHEKAFDMTYDWETYSLFNAIYQGKKSPHKIITQIQSETAKYPKNAYRMRFTSNHDENSWNGTEFERLGESAPAFATLCGTLPGMLLIYNGQEVGFNKRLSFFEKDTIVWKDSPFFGFYKTLAQLKKENPALHNAEFGGEFIPMVKDTASPVVSFIRKKGDNVVFVLTNLSRFQGDIDVRSEELTGTFYDAFTKEEAVLDGKFTAQFPPWAYTILVKK